MISLFSLREEESEELLWRLRGMYERLPEYLRARAVTHSNETRWICRMVRGRWRFRRGQDVPTPARWLWWMRPISCPNFPSF